MACNFDFLLDNPTEFTTGAFLGPTSTEAERKAAEGKAIGFFQHVGLLPKPSSLVSCPFVHANLTPCGQNMVPVADKSRAIGFRFSCKGSYNSPHPVTKVSPRNNTLFEQSNIPFYKILQIIISFINKKNVTEVMESTKVNPNTGVAWYRFLRAAAFVVAWHDFQPLGGHSFVIEVDESHLFKAKFNQGRQSAFQKGDMWIFGGACRSTGKTFDVLVHHRDRETLFQHMRRLIQPGSIVISDGWKAYHGCDQPSPRGCNMASHHVVIHKTNFVSPPAHEGPEWMSVQDWNFEARDKKFIGPYPEGMIPVRFHTQTRERKWRSEKAIVKSGNAVNWERVEDYIGFFMYQENILKQHQSLSGRFRQFLADLARVYPGPQKEGVKDKFRGTCRCSDCF